MKATNISERIRQIKDQIGRASLETAFDNLEDLIRSIDGMEIENEEEREFINQLITIKARYNNFNDTVIKGVGAQQTELNKITDSLLSLTDNVHDLLANNPDLIIPETVDPTPPKPPSSGEDKNGCLFSFNKSADQTIVNVKANWLKIFGGLAIFILALALGFKLIFGIFPSNSPDTEIPKVLTPPPPVPSPVKVAICPSVRDLRLNSAIGSQIGNYLLDPESTYPKRFKVESINYRKNGTRLDASAKKALDDLATCLKECENVNVDIYGYIGDNESGDYKGNKEITLDEVRARGIVDYLKSRGIDTDRLNFEGGGTSEKGGITIEINK